MRAEWSKFYRNEKCCYKHRVGSSPARSVQKDHPSWVVFLSIANLVVYLRVAGLTQAHEVVHRVRSTLRDWQDVVNLLHRGKPTSFETYLAERMCRRVPVTDTSPRMPVLLAYVRTALVLVILAAFFYAVLVTVLSVTEIGTTWVGTWSFGFVWHAASPFHDKSHHGTTPVMALYAFLHDTIIPHRRRKVVHDITHLSPHKSKTR